MRIKITGRNIELTEGLKAAVEDKLNKLEKYFTPDTDVYIDLVEEVIERQLKKYRTKLVTKQQNASAVFKQEFLDGAADEDEEIKIIRTKKFSMKPMYPEDACVQMELLGHDFFVFINAETEDVNVVYKRKGNTYGLIEPEN